MSRIRVDDEFAVRETSRQIVRVTAWNHAVAVAIGDKHGLTDSGKVLWALGAPTAQGLQLRLQRPYGDFLVPVLGTLLQSRQEFSAGADSVGRSGEEQELFGVLAGQPTRTISR